MKIEIDYQKVLDTNIDFLLKYYKNTGHIENSVTQNTAPLVNPYKLLTYLSFQFNNVVIIDLGTHNGLSALCLAQNRSNTVLTYDMQKPGSKDSGTKEIYLSEFQDKDLPYLQDYPNIIPIIKDVLKEDDSVFLRSPLISLDISHNGKDEIKFTDKLAKMDYKGYVLCDDTITDLFPLKKWFDGLDVEKYDVTEVGHVTGTGILNYHNDKSVVIKKQ